MIHRLAFVAALLVLALAPNTSSAAQDQNDQSVRVMTADLASADPIALSPVVVIGVMDGEEHEMFGDIRGIESDADGRIYILDFQSSDIRVFDRNGDFLHVLAGPGQGPGEISKANGMRLLPDGTLWIHDHGKWKMTVMDLDGNELKTTDLPVKSYSYIWKGTVRDNHVAWKRASVPDAASLSPSNKGHQVSSSKAYLVSHDAMVDKIDSLAIGRTEYESFIVNYGQGRAHLGIPFKNLPPITVDQISGYWHVESADYSISRFDESAERRFEIRAALDNIPVSKADHDLFMSNLTSQSIDFAEAASEIIEFIPDHKPQISALAVDDDGRLWVTRTQRVNESVILDVFDQSGIHLDSFSLEAAIKTFIPVRVSGTTLMAHALNEDGTPQALVFELPARYAK